MKKLLLLLIIIGGITGSILFFWMQRENRFVDVIPEIIVVGTSADYPPFSFFHDTCITGFDIEVIKEAIQRMGKKMVIKERMFDTLIPALEKCTVHVIAAGMSVTAERQKKILFTNPHFVGEKLLLITLKGSFPTKPAHITDLNGKIIAVNKDYTADAYVSSYVPTVQVMRLSTVSDVMLALLQKKVSGAVISLINGAISFENYGEELFDISMLPLPEDESIAFGVSPCYPRLLNELNGVLQIMEHEGVLENLRQKWHLSEKERHTYPYAY